MKKGLGFFSLVILIASMIGGFMQVHDFGKPPRTEMDDYFIANSQVEVAANNAVTAVVFDYRGFDTLGEATVLFAAVIGVATVLRRMKG